MEDTCTDLCDICGSDDLEFVKEPSSEPDCHISYCGDCNLVVCNRCYVIGNGQWGDDDDRFCPDCLFEQRTPTRKKKS